MPMPPSSEELATSLADSSGVAYFALGRRPLPAVLDTACVRTGLHFQLKNGCPPASVTTARDGSVRLFMEYDTLVETIGRLPRFAKQFGVEVAQLRRILDEDWLPHIGVVKVPSSWRQIDTRALTVREEDADDYAAAALAALLSPCILLTHNYRDFGALGVKTRSQGVNGVLAVIDTKVGETQVQGVLMVPALPIRAAGAATKWASSRIGSAAWTILGLMMAGGTHLYLSQSQERRQRVKKVAAEIGMHFLMQYAKATAEVQRARAQLRACVVPKPELRSTTSAILRELAISEYSLSAKQLADLIDPTLRPPVADLRAYLRANDEALFTQVRRGGFVLGRHYSLPELDT